MNSIAKIFGLVLLLGGVVIICWTLYSSYNIFTGKAPVPEFFEIPVNESIDDTVSLGELKDVQAAQDQIGKMMEQQLAKIMPPDVLNKFLNLAVWTMLAWILFSGGGKISEIGIKAIKN